MSWGGKYPFGWCKTWAGNAPQSAHGCSLAGFNLPALISIDTAWYAAFCPGFSGLSSRSVFGAGVYISFMIFILTFLRCHRRNKLFPSIVGGLSTVHGAILFLPFNLSLAMQAGMWKILNTIFSKHLPPFPAFKFSRCTPYDIEAAMWTGRLAVKIACQDTCGYLHRLPNL